jgi:dihydroflavonol-4-reductase
VIIGFYINTEKMKKIGIIGGSGFIGSYVTKQFLDHGFDVKVSTTDISRQEKYQHLMKFNHSETLQICEMNVEDRSSLEEFISDCDIVVHGGTPFILYFQDAEAQLFNPTIRGTEFFLEAVSKNKSVEKVIFIASVVGWNTNFPFPVEGKSLIDTFDETEKRFISTESHPYAQAKFRANQVVEEFIKENPKLSFEITTVSPVGVMGKSLSNREDSTSVGLQYLIKNKTVTDPFVKMLFDNDILFSLIDVGDVAKAIFKAATRTGIHGKDYLLSTESYKVSDMNLMLNRQEPKEKGAIVYKNDLAKNDLEMDFKPLKECLNNF